ncbi:pullulanase [Halovulum dunhuangense]|uniref:Pullulanase n=1 Tax=Halovulum dunhuangense TaxID=1505036 RepID=A0A849KQM3_9RHOB|nr:photosynthetic complex assembly protein PuhC [Halovulum dunhuangense]NNU79373.1 pullulanase [Halovulum dunhuangense]
MQTRTDIPMRVSDHEQMIPKVLLRAMAGLVVITLALVSFAVLTDRPPEAQTHTAPVAKSLLIQIKEGPESSVIVTDMNGNLLSDSSRPAAGFLSVVHSALAFERKRHGVTGEPPVHLVRFADGRLGLRDDATGWKIHLTGFGQDNHRVFAAILAE